MQRAKQTADRAISMWAVQYRGRREIISMWGIECAGCTVSREGDLCGEE